MTKKTKSKPRVAAGGKPTCSLKIGKAPMSKSYKGKTDFKAFEGKGVKISSAFNPDQTPTEIPLKLATFSGFKSKRRPYKPKIIFNWRCNF
jgi:hypothetical protein